MAPGTRRPGPATSAPAMRPRTASAAARWPSAELTRYARESASQALPGPEMRIAGIACGSARALLPDVRGEAAQRSEDLLVVRVVGTQLHRVLLLYRHGQLEHVERIEPEPVAEERRIRLDVLRPDAFQVQRLDDLPAERRARGDDRLAHLGGREALARGRGDRRVGDVVDGRHDAGRDCDQEGRGGERLQ